MESAVLVCDGFPKGGWYELPERSIQEGVLRFVRRRYFPPGELTGHFGAEHEEEPAVHVGQLQNLGERETDAC
jgi:hypothetical protein